MRSNNLSNRINIINYDIISKFNIYKKFEKEKFLNIKKLKFLALIDSSDKLFYKKIIVLSSIAINWFNQKLHLYKVINQKNMRKNNIFYQLGCTVNNLNHINNIINYINNIMKIIAFRIDNNLKLNYYNRYIIYTFNNLNYLLGFDNSKYFNIKINYNIVLIYNNNNNNNKLKEFYEKIFFL